MIELEPPTPVDLDRLTRQREWREQSVLRLTEQRTVRRDRLETDEFAGALRRAQGAYDALPNSSAHLRLRSPFVALSTKRPPAPEMGDSEPEEGNRAERRRKDWTTRPPLTRLIMGRSHALPSYLAMLYVAQATPSLTGRRWRNTRANAARRDGEASWAVVCGRWASTQRARRARIVRDLQELAATDLVEVAAQGQGRFENFRLLREDGHSKSYRVPTDGLTWPNALSLPDAFIRQGWHLVLSPAEIATLLVVRHHYLVTPRSPSEPGVGLPRSTRWNRYGLSGEAYGSIHELEEFGLLKVYDTMPHRRNGRLRLQTPEARGRQEAEGQDLAPVPYRLEPADDEAFDRPALPAVHACLLENPAPPRLLDVPPTLVLAGQ